MRVLPEHVDRLGSGLGLGLGLGFGLGVGVGLGLGLGLGLEMPMWYPSAVVKRSRCPGGGLYIGALPLLWKCRAAASASAIETGSTAPKPASMLAMSTWR